MQRRRFGNREGRFSIPSMKWWTCSAPSMRNLMRCALENVVHGLREPFSANGLKPPGSRLILEDELRVEYVP
jgi:hypothetical protein